MVPQRDRLDQGPEDNEKVRRGGNANNSLKAHTRLCALVLKVYTGIALSCKSAHETTTINGNRRVFTHTHPPSHIFSHFHCSPPPLPPQLTMVLISVLVDEIAFSWDLR